MLAEMSLLHPSAFKKSVKTSMTNLENISLSSALVNLQRTTILTNILNYTAKIAQLYHPSQYFHIIKNTE